MASQDSYGEADSGPGPSFEELVSLLYAPLFRFAMSLTHSETEACDLVQDAFLTWAQKGSQLKDRSRAKAWLFTTLHRRFLESRRRTSRFQHLELAEADAELPPVEAELMNRLDSQTLLALLEEIEPQFRAAVVLFYLEDYSQAEIAGILEVPVGTVKSRISRGLAQLKNLIRERGSRSVGKESDDA